MADDPNLAALEHLYRRWSETKGGTADEILELFDEEVEMRSVLSPDVPDEVSGTHFRRAQAAEYFAGLLRDWEMLSWDVERFIGGGDDIVMVGRCAWRNRATGNVIDTPKVDIFHFENGKVKQFTEMYDSLGFARALGAI